MHLCGSGGIWGGRFVTAIGLSALRAAQLDGAQPVAPESVNPNE